MHAAILHEVGDSYHVIEYEAGGGKAGSVTLRVEVLSSASVSSKGEVRTTIVSVNPAPGWSYKVKKSGGVNAAVEVTFANSVALLPRRSKRNTSLGRLSSTVDLYPAANSASVTSPGSGEIWIQQGLWRTKATFSRHPGATPGCRLALDVNYFGLIFKLFLH